MFKLEKPKSPQPDFNTNKLIVNISAKALSDRPVCPKELQQTLQDIKPEEAKQEEQMFIIY